MRRKIYLIGSLRNPAIPQIAEDLRSDGHEVFDGWYSAGPGADDAWKAHEEYMCHDLTEALAGPAAQNVLAFDDKWLNWADTSILVMPAGKSGHIELGLQIGRGKECHVLFPGKVGDVRWDVMYGLAKGVWTNFVLLAMRLKHGGH